MTPRVNGNVVSGHILALKEGGGGNGTRANDKERRLERMFVKVVQEVGGVECGTVIVGKTPGILRGARADIRRANTSTTRPPATASICGSVRVGWAPSSYSGIEGRDLDAGRLDLGNPLRNLWTVGGGDSVQLGVIGRMNG